MSNHINYFLRVLCILFLTASTNVTKANTFTTLPDGMEAPCNLPAPQALDVLATGSDWATFKWTLVPNAGGYRVQVKEPVNGAIVFDQSYPDNVNQVTATNLPVGATNLEVIVNAKCENGENSNNNIKEKFSTVIIDLIVQATGPTSPVVEIPSTGGEVAFDMGITDNIIIWGKTYKNDSENERYVYYRIEITMGPNDECSVDIGKTNGDPLALLLDNNELPVTANVPGVPYGKIKYDTEILSNRLTALVDFGKGGIVPQITISAVPAQDCNCTTKFYKLQSEAPNEGQVSTGTTNTALEAVKVVPNPFTHVFRLQDNTGVARWERLQIYDISGRVVFETADQSDTSLGESLLPGFYTLKLMSTQQTKTIQIVKH